MQKVLKIRDLTLRDGQQSLFATRMSQAQVDRLLPLYVDANFYAMEVWGGAVPDSVMRYLSENPWERLSSIKKGVGGASKLTALSRGRNLFGYNPYPDDVIEGFCRLAIQNGIDVMRIFDCLNDVDNMKSTIKFVKANGAMADCAICYTVDPRYSAKKRLKMLMRGKRAPREVFTLDYFTGKARELEALGADMITVKDMAGLVTPSKAGRLIAALKAAVKVPIDFHTHCTPGYGLASTLMAVIAGADVIDTNIMPFAGGPGAPAFEVMHLFCKKLGIDHGVNVEAVARIDRELRKVRAELADYDTTRRMPREFDIVNGKLPADVDALFDKAIEAARADDQETLLDAAHRIEAWFGFDAPNEAVKNAEIPGGMYTNMLAQLKQLKLESLLPVVLETVPEVRVDAGCPPLVTPTSQIVGAQAVNCVISQRKNEDKYSNISTQFHNLVKGWYGRTPIMVSPDFRQMVCGHRDAQPFDTASHKKPDNPEIVVGDLRRPLAENEPEMLLLELFPAVAAPYLRKVKESSMQAVVDERKAREAAAAEARRASYAALTPEQRRQRLEKGLGALLDWGSMDVHPELREM